MAQAAAKFFSYYNRPETVAAPTGDEFDKTYTVEIDKFGHKKLVVSGKTNRWEKIQSYKDECLIENILVRATMDPSVLDARKGMYFDATKMPKTLAEAQNTILKVKEDFFRLPIEIRKKFDNSPEVYVSQYGTKEWGDALGIVKEEVEKKKEEKKQEGEVEDGKQ